MASNIPVIVQGNSFSLAIPLQIYYINGDQMDLQDYTPDPTDEVSVQLKGSRRNYTYTPTIDGNVANIDLSGNELADNYGVVVSVVKANGQRLRSFRTDQFFIVESSDDLTPDDIIEGQENNVIYLNSQAFVAGADGRGIDSIVKTSTSGLVDTYTITYTDNTTSTFNVTNGAQGQDGQQGADGVGITSIEKTATVGLVDTYTITLSNGNTSTFEVTNGRDGVDLGLANIVNDLTTGGATNVLSAEMGKALMYGASSGDEEFEMTKNSKFMSCATIGATATESTSGAGGFGYIKIPVSNGDYFAVLAKGTNSNARTWALTDGDLKVLSNTNQTDVKFPTLVKAEADGFLLVNNYFDAFATPKVVKVVGGVNGEFAIPQGNGYVTCSTVGSSISYKGSAAWGYSVTPVVAGQTATIYTKGSANARAWALVGTGDKVLSNAVVNLDASSTPAVVNITETCLLLVNTNFNNYTGAKFITEGGGGGQQQPNLTDHEERIDALEALHPKKSLKILAIGNSFTENSLEYMPNFLTNLGVQNVTIYRVTIAASSIESWWTRFQSDYAITPTKVIGSDIANIGSTLRAVFAHEWDYVVFQQVSTLSGDYSTIEPNLYSLATHVKALSTNPNCKVAWHLTWSWSTLGTGTAPKGADGFASIASVAEDILDYYRGAGVDVIIPSGTALQNARGTSLNNEAELTKDYQHAAGGVAKYIICSTWYETLIKEFAGKSAMGSTLDVNATASSSDLGAESVTSSNRNLCLMCVQYAVNNKLHISTIVE